MEKQIAERYAAARRFDEGELFNGEEYRAVMRRQEHIRGLIAAIFGEGALALLSDYTDALYDEMELEAQHFFQEGCRA